MIFRIINDRIYSMHEQYLGRLKYSMAITDRGELIFTITRGRFLPAHFKPIQDRLRISRLRGCPPAAWL